MTIEKIIKRARRMGRISKDGLVLCDNCDNPADRELSQKLSWTCCGPCVFGESDSFDPSNLISVEPESEIGACTPMSTYRVWRDAWVKSADGAAEWEGCAVGEPCATVDEALAIVAAQTDWARYTIQETPIRLRVPHPFAGRPEDAAKRLASQLEAA